MAERFDALGTVNFYENTGSNPTLLNFVCFALIVCIPVYMFVCLYIRLFIYLFVCLFVICLYVLI